MIRHMAMAAYLTISIVCPSMSQAGANTFDCTGSTNTLEHYNRVLEVQKGNLTPLVRYNLGFTAICLGMYSKGLEHMRRASEGGHIAATKILGSYYSEDQSFDDVKNASMDNTYRAISYYEKAAAQIESIPTYPKGATEDMMYIEYITMTSYRVFTTLPALYFNVHVKMMREIWHDGKFFANSLKILQDMGDAATRCLRRPALEAWKEKKERVYRTQQIECAAYLQFVRAVYPMEDERRQIAEDCPIRVDKCPEHKAKVGQMAKAAHRLLQELKASPGYRGKS